MDIKTKIFSLVILVLLVVPILIGTQNSGGQVLGASENKQGAVNTNSVSTNDSIKSVQNRLGEIASGASEIVDQESTDTKPKVVKGRVIWEDNAKFKVISDKFPKGSGVEVKYNNLTIPLVVEDTRILSSDTVLVVDKNTFIKMGGNPETNSFIEVEVVN